LRRLQSLSIFFSAEKFKKKKTNLVNNVLLFNYRKQELLLRTIALHLLEVDKGYALV
jgi:hypothetical protein